MMPEREKVQHGLECCYNNNCGACPYSAIKKCQHKLHSDALALLKEQRWIPVTERLPEAEDHYLAAYRYPGSKDITYGILYYGFMDFKPEEGMCFYKYESEWGDVRYDNVTHWMKIPNVPKGEDDD